MLEQGGELLRRFRTDQRVRIKEPRTNLQVKLHRPLAVDGRGFLGYLDALGWVDGVHCVIEWKTSTQSYPESMPRVLELDLQLVCYSWMTQKSGRVSRQFRREAGARDPVPACPDPQAAVEGVRQDAWNPGERHGGADFLPALGDSLLQQPVSELLSPGAMPTPETAGGSQPDPGRGTRGPWIS